jgi:hypothetical protein
MEYQRQKAKEIEIDSLSHYIDSMVFASRKYGLEASDATSTIRSVVPFYKAES